MGELCVWTPIYALVGSGRSPQWAWVGGISVTGCLLAEEIVTLVDPLLCLFSVMRGTLFPLRSP